MGVSNQKDWAKKEEKVLIIFELFVKRHPKIKEKQAKRDKEAERKEKAVENEGRDSWRRWIFTVIASNSFYSGRVFFGFISKFLLRIKMTWLYFSTQIFARFLSSSLEETTILFLKDTSTLDRYIDHKHSL